MKYLLAAIFLILPSCNISVGADGKPRFGLNADEAQKVIDRIQYDK